MSAITDIPDWKLLEVEDAAGGPVKHLAPDFPCYFIAEDGTVISLCNPAHKVPARRHPRVVKPCKGSVRLYDRHSLARTVPVSDPVTQFWENTV